MLIASSCDKDDNSVWQLPSYYEDTSEYVTMFEDIEGSPLVIDDQHIVESKKVFPDGSNLFRPIFRIPSIIITNKGTLLVASENRVSTEDRDEIDIVISRRLDNNSSWEIRRVWKNDSMSYGRSMNPVFLIDRKGVRGLVGRVFLFTCHFKQNVSYANTAKPDEFDIVYKYSDDDGATWSPEYSLKEFCDLNKYDTIIPSAANGIQLDDGTFVLPLMIAKDEIWYSGIAYLKPDTDKWVFSKATSNANDNECTVYIDNQGETILDCRTAEKVRRKYIYDWNTDEWTLLTAPIPVNLNIKAEITACKVDGMNFFITCFCDTKQSLRENITLYGSTDAIHWKKICLIQEGMCHFAYANAACYGNKMVVVYETFLWGTRVVDFSSVITAVKDKVSNQ